MSFSLWYASTLAVCSEIIDANDAARELTFVWDDIFLDIYLVSREEMGS